MDYTSITRFIEIYNWARKQLQKVPSPNYLHFWQKNQVFLCEMGERKKQETLLPEIFNFLGEGLNKWSDTPKHLIFKGKIDWKTKELGENMCSNMLYAQWDISLENSLYYCVYTCLFWYRPSAKTERKVFNTVGFRMRSWKKIFLTKRKNNTRLDERGKHAEMQKCRNAWTQSLES